MNNEEDKPKLNRKERRKKTKFLLAQLEAHAKMKPKVNLVEFDDQKQFDNTMGIQKWAFRYGMLIKKLKEECGYEFEKYSERIHKRSVESGESAKRGLEESGKVQIGDLQLVPDIQPEVKEVSEE